LHQNKNLLEPYSPNSPQTGEEITIAASKSPAFKAGKQLKDAVK
jgi:nucleoid DNA-binding protein